MNVGGKKAVRELGNRQQATVFFASIVSVSIASLLLVTTAQAATYQRQPTVRVWTAGSTGYTKTTEWFAYDQAFTGGGSVALGDVGKDGKPELVTAAGVGGGPQVRVFRTDGSFLSQFFAYGESMHSGVRVAMGDVDGDKRGDIITGPQAGAGPQIRVFNSYGQIKGTAGWFAFDEAYHGGVNVAAGDLDGDGKAEVVVGSGIDMAPTVKVFNGTGTQVGSDYHPFADDNRGGVSVAVGNVDGGSDAEIITAIQTQGQAWVKIYKANTSQTVIGQWKAFADDFTGGINVAAADITSDGISEIIVSVQGRGGPQVKLFSATGTEVSPNFFAYEEDFQSGVRVAAAGTTIATLPGKLPPDGRTNEKRYVRVDLSEQRMYAYEDGYLVNSFLVSTGLSRTPTPPGETRIQRKIYSHLYIGPGYYLPNTLYNLQFRPHYYLHGAYWHNNFGHPMSHGCVNISYANAKWLFEWMQTGDLTVIEY